MSYPNYKNQEEKLLKKARKGGKLYLQKNKDKDQIKTSVQKTEQQEESDMKQYLKKGLPIQNFVSSKIILQN